MTSHLFLEKAIKADLTDPILAYAVDELLSILGHMQCLNTTSGTIWIDKLKGRFEFIIDSSMRDRGFTVECEEDEGSFHIWLTGVDSSNVLTAMYTMCEDAGVVFDITGPHYPPELSMNKLINRTIQINPFVKLRGIRQHLNFPMDISSYPVEEAKEYVRNLARMRFNHITFHSYIGQWYEFKLAEQEMLAGNFFYGQQHDIPNYPVLNTSIRNKEIFCIPEIEPYFNVSNEKSNRAMDWLRCVMEQAQAAGMLIHFSIEIKEESIAKSLLICEFVKKQYPSIDTLELFTQEGGGGSKVASKEEIVSLLDRNWGHEIAYNTMIHAILDDHLNMHQLYHTLCQFALNLKVAEELQKSWTGSDSPKLAVGTYCTEIPAIRILLEIVRKVVPSDITYTCLPSYGARSVVEHIRESGFTAKDLSYILLYNWIEFDGNMYLQQNAVTGIEQMISFASEECGNKQIHGLAFNHWRTFENRTAARYAALSCLYGPIKQENFYRDYANQLGIVDNNLYVMAMRLLDDAENVVRNDVFNIGFCYYGCWRVIQNWDPDKVNRSLNSYEEAMETFLALLEDGNAAAGQEYLAFIANRIQCTIMHLQACRELAKIQFLCMEDLIPEELKARCEIMDICREAMNKAEDYMRLHAENMPDRGCEGTLISYYHTLPQVIKRIQSLCLHGKAAFDEIRSYDAPPLPDL